MRGWSAYFKHAVTKHTFDTITRDAAPLMRGWSVHTARIGW